MPFKNMYQNRFTVKSTYWCTCIHCMQFEMKDFDKLVLKTGEKRIIKMPNSFKLVTS